MFEIPVHPLYGELCLHYKQWRLLGNENNCGLLLKTLRGNLKKAVVMQEVACSVFDSWQSPCPSHMMPLHLDGTLTYCGKVWVGFFLFALTHRGPWVPFTKFLRLLWTDVKISLGLEWPQMLILWVSGPFFFQLCTGQIAMWVSEPFSYNIPEPHVLSCISCASRGTIRSDIGLSDPHTRWRGRTETPILVLVKEDGGATPGSAWSLIGWNSSFTQASLKPHREAVFLMSGLCFP